MRNTQPRKIEIFHTQDRQEPFTEWLRSLQRSKPVAEVESTKFKDSQTQLIESDSPQ